MRHLYSWRPAFGRLYDHPAIEMAYPNGERELCLSGKKGEIWAFSDTQACVLCFSPVLANLVRKLALIAPWRGSRKGDEQVIKVPNHIVPKIIKQMRIPTSRSSQIKAANAFRNR